MQEAKRAARLGALCAFGPGVILFGWYYAQHHALAMPWTRIAIASCLLAPFTGAAFGGLIRLFVGLTNRPIPSGIVGGSLASIVAGVFAVAVFGSYRGPYAGSLEITVMSIVACWSLATLLTIDALGRRAIVEATGIVTLAAVITAAVTLGVTYLVAPAMFHQGIFVFTRQLAMAHGPVVIGCVLGASIGAIVGLHAGICIAIGRARR